mgnify:CR=1 FL=1
MSCLPCMGEVSSVFGMKITRGEYFIKVDQAQYISDVLVRFGMNAVKMNTPSCECCARLPDVSNAILASQRPKKYPQYTIITVLNVVIIYTKRSTRFEEYKVAYKNGKSVTKIA